MWYSDIDIRLNHPDLTPHGRGVAPLRHELARIGHIRESLRHSELERLPRPVARPGKGVASRVGQVISRMVSAISAMPGSMREAGIEE